MNRADKLLLRNGYDLKGNKTGVQRELLNKRQRIKRRSKPYIKKRKKSDYSPSENRIAKFLAENGISYEREYYLRGCNTKNGILLFFDFYLPKCHAVIEFDGLHHYKPVYGEEKFKRQKENDRIKNWFCRTRKIPILRIPCFDAANIETIICNWFDKLF